MTSPKAIQALREHLYLNQREFGDAIGVSKQRVSQLERGDGTLGVQMIRFLFKKYRQPLADLELSAMDFMTPGKRA